MLKSVILGWLGRRVPDWGGWLGILGTALFTVFDIFSRLSPQDQDFALGLLQGRWRELTFGAATSFIALVFSQVRSYKATVTPQVVTPDGKKATLEALPPSTRAKITVAAKNLPTKPAFDPLSWLKAAFTK